MENFRKSPFTSALGIVGTILGALVGQGVIPPEYQPVVSMVLGGISGVLGVTHPGSSVGVSVTRKFLILFGVLMFASGFVACSK